MRDPDTNGGPALPLGRRLAAHQFTNAQLLAIDVITVTVITWLSSSGVGTGDAPCSSERSLPGNGTRSGIGFLPGEFAFGLPRLWRGIRASTHRLRSYIFLSFFLWISLGCP